MLSKSKELRSRIFSYKFYLLSFLFILGLIFVIPLMAGTTPPITTHSFSGTEGENGWYVSTVDVTLSVADFESGPASTTYWIDSDAPVTVNYSSSENQLMNPSFEEVNRHGRWPFYYYTIRHWDDNDCALCPVLFWSSSEYALFGSRSAAIGILGSGNYYYTNKGRYINVSSGETYTVSVWVKTLDLWGSPGAWMEVWANQNAAEDGIKIGESAKVIGNEDWMPVSVTFTIPEGYNKAYMKLIAENDGFIGVAYFDGATLFGGTDFFTTFTVVDNGIHNIYYYSIDNNGNVETVKDTILKIDTVGPQDWDNFDFEQHLTNTNDYKGEIEVRDVTSGVQVATAEYSYYRTLNDEGWDRNGDGETDWFAVDDLEILASGLPVSNGETALIKLITPYIDFGGDSGPKRIQFRLKDMAGNLTNSPVMTIGGPWIELDGQGETYSVDSIIMSNLPSVEDEENSDGFVSSGGVEITNFLTESDISFTGYEYKTINSLIDVVTDYELLKKDAVVLPDNKLPEADGVYIFGGDYTVDFNTILSGFTGNEIKALIIIEGGLRVHESYSLHEGSKVVFVVEDNIEFKGDVSEVGGVFISGGMIDTNYDSQFNQQLEIKGSLVGIQGFDLGRDLGKDGDPSNLTEPAEKISFPVSFFFDEEIAKLIGRSKIKVIWEE